jgi:hypothetical protein
MWQTAIVLLIVAGVLVYLMRYLSKAYRSQSFTCSSCSLDCPHRGNDAAITGEVAGMCPPSVDEQTSEDGRFDQQ